MSDGTRRALPEDLLVVAGEASGDLHGARLLAELRRLRPELSTWGMGGDEMRRTGFEAVADSAEIAVVGISEALKVLRRARQIFALLLAETERRGTRCAVLIDFAEFNMRLAAKLRRRGLRVIYYISPQVWAWRRRRVKAVARNVDRMLVLFPFEAEFYRRHGVRAVHVGHPLVDEVPRLAGAWDRSRAADGRFVVSLLPGSRRSEIAALLPAMLASCRLLAERLPIAVQLIRAPAVPEEAFATAVADSGLDEVVEAVGITLHSGEDRFAAIAASHLALCASGTATLEVGLLGTPMIVLYRLKPGSLVLAKLLVDLQHFSMVNLVLDRGAVPEILQPRPEKVAAVAVELLGDEDRVVAMRSALGELRERLGEGGASRRAAAEVDAELEALG